MSSPPTTNAPRSGGLVGWIAGRVAGVGDASVGMIAAVGDVDRLISRLKDGFPFLCDFWAKRLVRAYGTEARSVLGDAGDAEALGRDFGATLTEAEVVWLMDKEYARRAADVVWRRSKLGLRMTTEQVAELDRWMKEHPAKTAAA